VSTRLDNIFYVGVHAEIFAVIAGNLLVSNQLFDLSERKNPRCSASQPRKFLKLRPRENNLHQPWHTALLINENEMKVVKAVRAKKSYG
jgi:hypothetical protein